jgi:hypothetical protein
VDVDRSEGEQRGLVQDHERVRDRDIDIAEGICSEISVATFDNQRRILPRPSNLGDVVTYTHNYKRAPEPLRSSDSHFQLLEAENGRTLFLHLTNISFQIIRKELFNHTLMVLEREDYTPQMTWVQMTNQETQHTTYTTHTIDDVMKVISTAQNKLETYRTIYQVPTPWTYRQRILLTHLYHNRAEAVLRERLEQQRITELQKETRDQENKQIMGNLFRK